LTSPPSSGLAILYARDGRMDDTRATVQALQELAQKQYVSPYGIASYYAVIGDNDHALDWLEKAYSERDGTLRHFAENLQILADQYETWGTAPAHQTRVVPHRSLASSVRGQGRCPTLFEETKMKRDLCLVATES
jgi:Flp pilus assembly protein TadD